MLRCSGMTVQRTGPRSRGFTIAPTTIPTMPPTSAPSKAMIKNPLPKRPPTWPIEKKRIAKMPASKAAARTEQTAPAMMPTRTSLTRKNTLGMFAFAHNVSSKDMQITVRDIAALHTFARDFAAGLQPGDSVALEGSLGSGKTTLVRAIVNALHGSDDAVSSPTFVFRHRYDGAPLIEHLDLYRIEDPAELIELGLDDAFASDRITLVEWPDRAPGLVPPDAIRVAIAGSGNGPREITVRR
jgi:tRNA threonylcarbamoyladenosine biosynthesis protein TsaE